MSNPIDSLKKLYKKRNEAIDFNCVSVLYRGKKPIIFAINGENDFKRTVIRHVRNVLGEEPWQATINDAFSFIKPAVGKTTKTIDARKTKKSISDRFAYYSIEVDLNEPKDFAFFNSTIHERDEEKRFFTCAEKKVIGAFTKELIVPLINSVVCFNTNEYRLFSVIKPCAICEPALQECYFLNEPKDLSKQVLKRQTIEIIQTAPSLIYRLRRYVV